MLMNTGERWICTSAVCRCVVFVESPGKIEGQNPRCACGSAMKKQYKTPAFQYLDFLRFPEHVLVSGESPKE